MNPATTPRHAALKTRKHLFERVCALERILASHHASRSPVFSALASIFNLDTLRLPADISAP